MRKPSLILLALLTCLIPASSFAQIDIAPGRYEKAIVVIGENLGYDDLFTTDHANDEWGDYATYINDPNTGLLSVAVNYSNAHSNLHPSLPNYLALFSGSNQGIGADGCVCGTGNPDPCGDTITCNGNSYSAVTAPTIYSRLKNDLDGDTRFVLYVEGLNDNNTNNFVCSNADYYQKHNPAAFFTASRSDEACNQLGTVWTGFGQNSSPPAPETLPKGVTFIVPGQDHNGHNGTNTQAKTIAWNTWLLNNMPTYVDYALQRNNYKNNTDTVLLIITQDEKSAGYYGDPNHILLLLIAADLTPTTDCANLPMAHYNTLKTITKDFGVSDLNSGYSALIPLIACP